MTRDLLWRGMLAGVIAAVLVTLFARAFAEPQVDLAIAFEASHGEVHDHAMPGMTAAAPAAPEPELVSRDTQKGIGLLTAVGLYGAAVGGIFALVFAYAYGRVGQTGPRTLALILAATAFVVIALVPALKYPPTPPAVGQHETVALRTIAYFLMIVSSIVAAVVSLNLARRLSPRLGGLNATLFGVALYILMVAVVQAALPVVNEVPRDFPATVLWNFRIASIATQLVLWSVIGIGFGLLARRVLRKA